MIITIDPVKIIKRVSRKGYSNCRSMSEQVIKSKKRYSRKSKYKPSYI